jgi:hypothetical protein
MPGLDLKCCSRAPRLPCSAAWTPEVALPGDPAKVALDLRTAVIGMLSLRINEPDLPWPPLAEQADRFLAKFVGVTPSTEHLTRYAVTDGTGERDADRAELDETAAVIVQPGATRRA